MKIALTGGIACGKSLVARFLRELGFAVLDADDVVHELEAPGGAAIPAIASVFGREALSPDGGVDRARLAQTVFADASARRSLEAILHPLVRARMLAFAAGTDVVSRVSVIPLLFESHWETDYDTILCVSSATETQIGRMMQTRGYTRVQAEARLAAQMPVAEKAARADWTIHNDSTKQQLKAEVQRCVAWLVGRMEKAI